VNPCADPLVRELLARTRRAYAQRGDAPKRQRALTKDPLERLLATCDASLKGKRDRALLLFAWASGGRRRSEVASAVLENLQRVNSDAFVYTLTQSKTNQRGELRPEDVKPLVGRAAAALQEWLAVLQALGIKEGRIFRRIRRGGHLGEPLAPAAFPAFAPFLALTRIWVRPVGAMMSIEVHRTPLSQRASDHLPVKAVIDVEKFAI
jgi:integrase